MLSRGCFRREQERELHTWHWRHVKHPRLLTIRPVARLRDARANLNRAAMTVGNLQQMIETRAARAVAHGEFGDTQLCCMVNRLSVGVDGGGAGRIVLQGRAQSAAVVGYADLEKAARATSEHLHGQEAANAVVVVERILRHLGDGFGDIECVVLLVPQAITQHANDLIQQGGQVHTALQFSDLNEQRVALSHQVEKERSRWGNSWKEVGDRLDSARKASAQEPGSDPLLLDVYKSLLVRPCERVAGSGQLDERAGANELDSPQVKHAVVCHKRIVGR